MHELKRQLDLLLENTETIINQNNNIIKNQIKIMALSDQIAASIAEIEQATTDIGNRIQTLINQGLGNVTQAQADQLQKDADALKALGTPAP